MTSWDSSSLSFGSHRCIVQSALVCTFVLKASLWPRCHRGTSKGPRTYFSSRFQRTHVHHGRHGGEKVWRRPLHHGSPRSKGKACWTQKQLIPSKARPANLLPPTRLYLLKAPGNQHSKHKALETTQIQTVSASHERHPGPTHCILVSLSKT